MIWTIKFVTAWFVQTCTNVGSHTSAISVFITSSRTVKVLSFSSCVILWNVCNTKIYMEYNRNFTAGNCPSRKWIEYLYCHPWCNFCSAYVLSWYFWWRSRGLKDKASESVQFGFFLSQTACCLSQMPPRQHNKDKIEIWSVQNGWTHIRSAQFSDVVWYVDRISRPPQL